MIPATLKNKQNAFTIVELMIVVIVIAILAAITIVSYTAIADSSKKQKIATDLQTKGSELSKYNSNNGAYPTSLSLLTNTSSGVDSSFVYTYTAASNTYCLTGYNTKYTKYIVSGSSTVTDGICSGQVVPGITTITNLATDPGFEYNSTPPIWNQNGTNALTTSSMPVHSGSKTMTNNMTTTGVESIYYQVSAAASETYSVSIWVYGCAASSVSLVAIPSSTVIGTGSSVPGTWRKLTASGTTVSGTTAVRVVLTKAAGGTCTPAYYDDIMFTKTTLPQTYADGNTSGWSWSGTRGYSTSSGPAL